MAHSTQTEIKEQMEFEDKFRIIEEAVNLLFDGDDLAEPRRKWRQILHQIRTDDISVLEPQTREFPLQAAAVREIEMNFFCRDIIGTKNITKIQKNVAVQNVQIICNTTYQHSGNNNNSNSSSSDDNHNINVLIDCENADREGKI